MRIVLLLLAILVTVRVGWRAATPPTALSADAPATVFSAGRAIGDVHAIAMHPHPTGSAANGKVAAYLAARLVRLGLTVQERRYLIDDGGLATLRRWSEGEDRASEMTDVVGVLPGRDRSAPAVLVQAHYDTVWGSPGGGDDSAGVASALEIARAVNARGIPARDLIILFTDGEEIGLSGAKAFWSGDVLARHAGVVVNLDVRGLGGRATMFETGDGNGAMMRLFGRSVHAPVANSMSVLAYRHLPNDTDFSLPRKLGLPGFNFAFMGRAAYYHSPQATIDRLDPRSLQDMGGQALDIVAGLAFASALPGRAADVGFFDWLGHRLVSYGTGTGWLIVLGAFAALGVAAAALWRRRAISAGPMLAGLGAALWLVVHAVLGLDLYNRLSAGTAPNYYDRLAKLSLLETQAWLVALASLGGYALLGCPRRRWATVLPTLVLALFVLMLGGLHGLTLRLVLGGLVLGLLLPPRGVPLWGGWLGGIALLAVIGLVAQIEAPTAAWVFAVPALLLSATAAIVAWLDPRLDRGFGLVAVAGMAAFVSAPLVPLAHIGFLGIGADLPAILLLVLPTIAIAFWPLIRADAWRPSLVAIVAMLIAAGAIAHHLQHAPLAPSIPAYSLDK